MAGKIVHIRKGHHPTPPVHNRVPSGHDPEAADQRVEHLQFFLLINYGNGV